MTTNNLPYLETTRNEQPILWRPVTDYQLIYIDGKPFTLRPGKDVELLNPKTGQHWRNNPSDFIQNWKLDEHGRKIFNRYYPDILDVE